jgi:xylulokinase
VGRLTAAAAEELGLTTACVAVAGTGDDHAAALGAGVVGPGVIADVTGTAEPVGAATVDAVFDDEHLVETHAHAVDGMFLVENPGFVSGGSTMWLAGALRGSQQDVFDWASLAPAGSDGVIFLPALSGATTPRWNDRMRGAFHGLSMNHDHTHLSRAVIEGCVYALRDITDRLSAMGLGGNEIRVVGGGTRSALWMQTKADVTSLPIRPVLVPEPTALGAAMLAGVGAGIFRDVPEAAERMTRLAEACYEPSPARAAVYEDAYRSYRRCFDAVEGTIS